MNRVVPAIIPQSFDHLKDALATIAPFTREVQIDIVDGSFVPFTSWPYRGGSSVLLLREYMNRFDIEVDLMIERPEEALPFYVEAGVKSVVVHLESTQDLESIYALKKERDFILGISITNDTPLELLEHNVEHAEYVQLMGIRKIGSQGQPFDTEVLMRIKALRERYPNLLISIDGSVNEKTLPLLKAAGANRFVAGSAIMGAVSPQEAYHTLASL